MPASEWLTNEAGNVGWMIPDLASAAAMTAGITVAPPDTVIVVNEHDVSMVQKPPPRWTPPFSLSADNRALVAEGHAVYVDDQAMICDSVVDDADGNRIGFGRTTMSLVPRREADHDLAADRVLATVLFVDTVDSTSTLERVGDATWRRLLEQNLTSARREIQATGGREVKTEGDGFLATFDSPARAIRCARAVRDASMRHGLAVRAGIHLGEVELIGSDVAGIAVHVASRVESIAQPGEILVTSTVREAMAGSGLTFRTRGAQQLKGIQNEWQLFAVEDPND